MPALVLLHAFPLDRSMWDREVRALVDVASPIIAPSFPGFGRSELPNGQPTLDDYADAAIAAMDAAGVKTAAIAGLSMGGYVALALAARHRTRVARLALVDSRVEGDSEDARAGRAKAMALVSSRGALALYESLVPRLFAAEPVAQAPDRARSGRGEVLCRAPHR